MTKISTPIGSLIIKAGITDSQVKELIYYSHTDPVIKKFTSDQTRFKDETTYIKRLKEKVRAYYSLSDKSGKLFGIIWFGPKELPDWFEDKNLYKSYTITFAIRLYDLARGKGIANKFLKSTINMYTNSIDYKKHSGGRLWCLVEKFNQAAIHVYLKTGFKPISNASPDKEIMLLE